MDTREDELDYGEEELGDHNGVPSSFQPGGDVSSFADEEMLQDEEYEDLYDDVNIGYFEPPAEISKRTGGEGFEGDFEEEEAYANIERSGDVPLYGTNQENLQAPPAVVQGGPEEAHTSPNQKKQEERNAFALARPKDDAVDELDSKPSWIGRSAETPTTMNYGLEGPQKASVPVILVRPKDEKDREVARTPERATTPLKVKDEEDSVRSGVEQRTAAVPMHPSQERGVKGNGLASAQTFGTLHIGNGKEYEGNNIAEEILTGEATKMVGSFNVRGRGSGRLPDGGRGSGGGGRLSQGGGYREPSSAAVNDYPTRHGGQSHTSDGVGGSMLFVGELHWWTTDAEIEAALSEFGSVKNIKFFEERASGKSKGYCQVEFYDRAAAAACKEGMNGTKFHGRPCLVAFADPRTVMQMGTAQVNKAQAQLQAQQAYPPSRRMMNDSGGSNRGGPPYQGGDSSRGYGGRMGAGGRGGHGQGMGSKGGYSGPTRGKVSMGNKGMSGNGGGPGTAYGQGLAGPMGSHPSGMIMPQGMMGQGYDQGYGPPMSRGGPTYGGYVLPGPHFSGMVPPFPNMGPGAIAGVAPHVNPAFFSRTATTNGIGMMTGSGMDASLTGLWGDGSMSGWATEDHNRRARETSYGDDIGGSEYGYGNEIGYEKGRASGGREKDWDRVTDGDLSERRWRDDRDGERERHRERDGHRDQRERERERVKDDDWEREKLGRTRNKIRMVEEEEDDDEEEEEKHPRSREEYAKRRRLANER